MASIDLTMLQWNCRGANEKPIEITYLLDKLNPMAMILNETFYYPLSSVLLPKFAVFRQDREQNPEELLYRGSCGGSAILVREGSTVISEQKLSLTGEKRSEWLSLDVIPDSQTAVIRIATGYCPPTSTLDLRWLESRFEECNRAKMPCFFAGDLNAKSPLWSSDPWNANGFTLHHAATRLGLTVLKSKPTRININNGALSTLDLWVVNEPARVLIEGAVARGERLSSDHFNTSIRCKMPIIGHRAPAPALEALDRYDFSKADRWGYYRTLRDLLKNVRVPDVGEPVANLVQYRKDIINCILVSRRMHVPLCDRTALKKIAMSQEMRWILKRKRILEHARGNHYDPESTARLKVLDKAFNLAKHRHQLRHDINNLRLVEALSAQKRYKEAWARLRMLDRHRQPRKIDHMRLADGHVLAPSTELADALLDQFTKPMSPYADPAADDATRERWQEIEQEVASGADFQPSATIRLPAVDEFSVSQRLIADAVFRLQPFKAPGVDGIVNVFYKWGGVPLQIHLRQMYNMCLGSRVTIPEWKHAEVVAVPKPGKPRDMVSSQRPISLLPTDAKILESVVARWMSTFLEERHLLPEDQYGFREHRSAPDIPLRVVQRVHNCRGARRKMVVVALDVQAAYDSVWHAGLIHKLALLPLPKNLIGWIVDFLRDRKLQAKVSGFLSRQAVVNCGVPQGSPLSPLLYILYTADLLTNNNSNSSTEAYADDLTICADGRDFPEAQQAAQLEVDRISLWARIWRQKFNANKSETMPFCWTPMAVNISVDGSLIPQVGVLRILGIFFDPRLTFKEHFDRVIRRCSENLSFFRRLVWTPGLSRSWKRTAYLALVRSGITYGNVALCNASKRQKKRLDVVQNNCLRAILNVRLEDRVRVTDLQARCRVESLDHFFAKTQRRYIEKAVCNVLSIREDVEAFRNNPSPPLRSPFAVLNSKLPPGPLPPPAL